MKGKQEGNPLCCLKTQRGSERKDSVGLRYHVKREMLDEVLKPVVRLGEIFGKDRTKAQTKKMGEINKNREQRKRNSRES